MITDKIWLVKRRFLGAIEGTETLTQLDKVLSSGKDFLGRSEIQEC